MKRSGFGPRKTPMSRGSWKSSPTDTKDWRAELRANPKRSTLKSKPKRPTVAESTYMGFVANLGCAVCRRLGLGETPAIVHHQRTGQGKMRASDYRTAPLCPHHHQHSGFGVHDMGRPQFEAMYGFSEVELVEETRELLSEHIPEGF